MAVLHSNYAQAFTAPAPVNTPAGVATNNAVIDGTPVRVAMLCLGAAVGIAALRWAGFRFNVGI